MALLLARHLIITLVASSGANYRAGLDEPRINWTNAMAQTNAQAVADFVVSLGVNDIPAAIP